MNRLSRLLDVTQKGWKYLLDFVERPTEIPSLAGALLRGVHMGEFLRLNSVWIRQASIHTIIDVGSHKGQFASAARAVLPTAQIYAFEPLADCFGKLQSRFGGDELFQAFNVAIGETSGEARLYRSSFSKSSSMLPMMRLHQMAFPWSATNVPSFVQMETLDHFLDRIKLEPKVLLKIDVQGYENRVLRGSPEILKRIDYLIIEVSFRLLYEEQASFDEVYRFLVKRGFSYSGNLGQLLSPLDSSILQGDALFVRNELLRSELQ